MSEKKRRKPTRRDLLIVIGIARDVRPEFRAWFEQECAALEKKYPPQ